MIIDTSAIIAILFNETDAKTYAQAIAQADSCRVSAATFVELAIVVEAQTKRIAAAANSTLFCAAPVSPLTP